MTYLLWIIKNPKDALLGLFGFIIALLWGANKYRAAKVEKLEDEVQTTTKALDIEKKQSSAIAEIKDNELEEIMLEVKENAKKSKSDRIDNW